MAAPQLRLEVSLNLTGFRSEIQKLTNIAQSEFAPKINVKFNRRTLDTELNNLQAAIKRRTYRVEIGGNINSFPRAIENIRKQLAALETQNKIEIPISVKNGVTQKEARKVRSSVYRSVMTEGGKILLPVGLKPVSQTASDKFKTDLRKKLGSITVKIKADLESASISSGAKSRSDIETDVRRGLEAISEIGAQRMAGSGGGVTEAARREQLRQSLTTGGFGIGGLKDIGKQLGVAGVGRFKNVNNLINKIVTDSSIEMVKKYLDPQAVMRNPDRSGLGKVLDTFARGIFNMLGMDPASIRAQQQASKPKPFTPAGLLPAAYRGIGPSAEPAGLLPPAYRGIGPSASPAGLLPPLSSAGRSKAITEALIASTGPRLLPSGGGDNSLGKLAAPRQTKDAVDAILRNYFKVVEAQVREVFSAPPIKKESLNIFDHLDTEQYFNYLAQARVNAENAIKQSIEEAKQVTRRNQIKDAAQSFLRALEETVRNAERSVFVQSRIAANQSYVQKANIREIGQPLLGGRQVVAPKMLSAATGFYRGAAVPPPLPETQAQLFARREREARMRSVLRGVDVMGETPTRAPARYSYANRPAMPRRPTSAIVPYEAGGALVPSGGGGAVPPVPPRGGGGGGGSFGGMQFNVPQLPGAGLVREIGTEFGFAAKQVLLFGTAYKALALIQGFPAQVGEAVGALQTFRNTIKEISPSAKEAAESSQFILDIVEKYNTPLQSARDGFVKLYASMQPAGFSGDEIRDLFLGISQTAATFGMSADKVDRVNYAFAQMASKGQVMSEELKGQLGDVLPGAMAIFAEAAGFKGPEAITKFSKALEDGAYKGGAMKTLLTNVGSIMRQEFGPGAEGAARTFQGVMNRMQNSAKLLYEAFEPVAVGFLNSVVMPLTSGLKTVTDGFNAFFTGVSAKTTGGFAFAQELEKLRPTFEGIRANVTALLPTLQSFANTLLNVSKVFLQIVGNPFVGYLARVYLNVLALTTAINILNLRALIPMIANFVRSAYSLIVFTAQCIRASIATRSFGMAVSTAGLMLRTFFATTGIGLVLVGIGLLIERFTSMNQSLADTKAKALGAAEAIRSLSRTEAISEGRKQRQVVADLKALQGSKDYLRKGGETVVKVPEAMVKRLEAQGIPLSKERGVFGGASVIPQNMLESYVQRHSGLQAEAENVPRALAYTERQTQQSVDIAPITPGGGGGGGGSSKLDTYDRSTLDFIKLRLEAEKQSLDQRRQAGLLSETSYKIAVAELELESSKKEVAERLRLSRLAINKDNLSAADKVLKIKDMEILAERELIIAADKRNIAVEGARKELSGPFDSAIKDANFSMVEQKMLLENLQSGIEGLTAKQQAYLKVLEMTKDLSEDEFDILKDRIRLTSGAVEREILSKQEVRQGTILNELGGQLRLAQTLDPKAELRETLRQQNPLFSETQIEQQAVLSEQVAAAQKAKDDLKGIASTISNAFGEAFKGIVTGSMTAREALTGFFQGVADSFADMVANMIAEYLKMALIKGIMSLIPGLGSFGGGAAVGQAVSMPTGVGIGAGGGILQNSAAQGFGTFGPNFGIRQFANGGIVTGPTLGLVGEGRYNEAVIPLPDGKSVPVQLSGGDGGNQINSNITVNVSNGQAQSNATGSNSSELGRKIEGAVKQVIVGELRPGGLLASR